MLQVSVSRNLNRKMAVYTDVASLRLQKPENKITIYTDAASLRLQKPE